MAPVRSSARTRTPGVSTRSGYSPQAALSGAQDLNGPSSALQLLVFRLDDRRYALPLQAVDRAVRAVDVTPLPGAPGVVLGAINVSGQIVPVLNVRRRFRVPERAVRLTDWFLLARTARRAVALVVDESEGIVQRDRREISASAEIGPVRTAFPGVTSHDDGLMFIHDLDLFLGLDDEQALDDALSRIDDSGASGPTSTRTGPRA